MKRSKKKPEHIPNLIPAEDFWAATAHSDKLIREQWPDKAVHMLDIVTRKSYIEHTLANPSLITEEDRTFARDMMAYQRGRMLDLIVGKVTHYSRVVISLFLQDEIDTNQANSFTFGASQPEYFRAYLLRKQRADLIAQAKLTSQHVGKRGDRIEVRGELLHVFPLRNNSYGRDTNGHVLLGNDGNLYFYWHSMIDMQEGQTVTIRGTVLEHTDGATTKLNRVRYTTE